MSKLGNGGLLGNSPDLNARREADEELPPQARPRTVRSALGSVVAAPQQGLAGAGGLPGEPARPHVPGPFNRKGQQAA